MQPVHLDHAEDGRLRFVFDDAVVSLRLAANATFEDIARTLEELAPQHYGGPLAIDVTVGAAAGMTRFAACRVDHGLESSDQTALGCGSAGHAAHRSRTQSMITDTHYIFAQ